MSIQAVSAALRQPTAAKPFKPQQKSPQTAAAISYRQSRISTKCPAIAAAAAIAGDTRCVLPLKPWPPSKLRLEVEAQRSSGASLSGFIARHIEQPGSRHSNPAFTKI